MTSHNHTTPVVGCMGCASNLDPEFSKAYYEATMKRARGIVESHLALRSKFRYTGDNNETNNPKE